MSVGDSFVTFDEFFEDVCKTETGILNLMIQNLRDVMVTQNPEVEDNYYLRYPFHSGYESIVIAHDWYSKDTIRSKYRNWLKENPNVRTNPNTPLPIFTDNFNWESYYQSRLRAFLENTISKEEYEQYEKNAVFLCNDRNRFLIVDNEEEQETATFFVAAHEVIMPISGEKKICFSWAIHTGDIEEPNILLIDTFNPPDDCAFLGSHIMLSKYESDDINDYSIDQNSIGEYAHNNANDIFRQSMRISEAYVDPNNKKLKQTLLEILLNEELQEKIIQETATIRYFKGCTYEGLRDFVDY